MHSDMNSGLLVFDATPGRQRSNDIDEVHPVRRDKHKDLSNGTLYA
jgi:hypothetical protein